jgi:hypothetical protein
MTGIPSHLSLPLFDLWRQNYLMTNNGRSAVNGIAFRPEDKIVPIWRLR